MKKGFSVAEAMLTLLLVSVVLAAAAPMFTKRENTTKALLAAASYVMQGVVINEVTGEGEPNIGLSSAVGNGVPIDIRPPYYTVAYIMKQ